MAARWLALLLVLLALVATVVWCTVGRSAARTVCPSAEDSGAVTTRTVELADAPAVDAAREAAATEPRAAAVGERRRDPPRVVPDWHSRLEFRLLAPDGAPLRGRRVRTQLVYEPKEWSDVDATVRSDVDGVVVLAVPPATQVVSKLKVRTDDDEGRELVGVLELTLALRPGTIELGDLRMADAPLLVAGRVVDASGAAVAGARVVIRGVGADESLFVRDADVDGRFAFTDDAPAEELVLHARAPGHLPAPPLAFRRGASDVVLALPAAATIAGSIAHDEGEFVSGIDVVLVRPDARTTVAPAADGTFAFRGIPAGTYDVEFHARGGNRIAIVAGVRATADETERDPRLQNVPLPLRGLAAFRPRFVPDSHDHAFEHELPRNLKSVRVLVDAPR